MRIANGDSVAFAWLYESTYPGLYFHAKKFVGEDRGKDIVAETFVKLWKSPKKFDSLVHANSYLRIVIKNACIDLLKKESDWDVRQSEWLRFSDTEYDGFEGAAEELKAMLYKKVLDEIEALPNFTRSIFKLSYLEGKSNAEICSILNIKDQTVRNKKAEAIKQLRLRLGPLLIFLPGIKFFPPF
ncbi:MAG: sigma-70 family RNA polymerase sigma factor [Chitinophagaceae bacterium]|nr:sigma-70 family RNA polymerase sigma factor [Chitinophagaceae bacterium]